MFWGAVELVGAALGVLIAAVVVLVAVAVVGFALMLIVAVPVAIVQVAIETYRETFGPSAELRRTREALDAEERALFEEALQELQSDALNPEEELVPQSRKLSSQPRAGERWIGPRGLGGYY
jgi:hypothetical protein